MSGITEHINNDEEAIKRSMEEYSRELITGGWKEDSQGYKSLMALHHHLITTPQEELEQIAAEVDALGIEGPTIEEYLESTNPQAMYQKGYREGALRYKGLVEEFLKGWVAQIKEEKEAKFKEDKERAERKRKESGEEAGKFVFISPGVSFKDGIEFHPRPIEDIIEGYILPQMQEIFDNN